MKNEFVKSPLNYIGGKTRILSQILPLFPAEISTFVEPFCGGYNVGPNVFAQNVIAIDVNKYLIELLDCIYKTETVVFEKEVESVIKKYSLSLENQSGYLELRKDYNESKDPIQLFALICFSFNHQIRFNNNFFFNTPFGKNRSCYNKSTKSNLEIFSCALKKQLISFRTGDFSSFDINSLDQKSFVYCDPPYRISTGSYNDGFRGFGDWTLEFDKRLFCLLDKIHANGIKFALSNVFIHNNEENTFLIEWSKKYCVHFINCDYNNSNYHSNAKNYKTVEVLITNY